jgi:AcrR family transcriptional regulator
MNTPGVADRSQRARQALDTRRRLIAAAGDLFAERGYAGSSVAAIGEAAGASRGLVNFHFGSKEKLLWAVVEDFVRELEEQVLVAAAGRTGIDAVRAAIDAQKRMVLERPARARLLYRLLFEAIDERRGLNEQFGALMGRWQAVSHEWWQQGIAAGQVDPSLNHAAVVGFVMGAIRGIALDWLIAPESVDLDATYDQLWRSFVRGVAPGAAEVTMDAAES